LSIKLGRNLKETAMLKKLAVPFLALALATFGCSSSTTNNGTGGSGGGAGTGAAGGKGGGAAGSSAAGTSGGGGKAGEGGAAGSSAAGTNGGGGKAGGGGAAAGSGGGAGSSTAGTSGGAGGAGGSKKDAGTSMADCTVTDSTGTDKLTASIFCAQMEAYCPSQFTTEAACESTYNSSGQEHCRSYHMCWGVEGISMEGGVGNPTVHCPHTIGHNGVCVATTDAASGN
jgi:hypothetical protein